MKKACIKERIQPTNHCTALNLRMDWDPLPHVYLYKYVLSLFVALLCGLFSLHPFLMIHSEAFMKGSLNVFGVKSHRMFPKNVCYMVRRFFAPIPQNLVLVRRIDANILVVSERINALFKR